MRGRPTSPRSSTVQKLTESRISGLSGRFGEDVLAGRVDTAGQIGAHCVLLCS